jgi:hypothetical protein
MLRALSKCTLPLRKIHIVESITVKEMKKALSRAKTREKYKMWNPHSIPLDTHHYGSVFARFCPIFFLDVPYFGLFLPDFGEEDLVILFVIYIT